MAAEKIGCKFEVSRKPKKRILREMQEGTIDFYPGFNFTKERATYTYYFENGLPGGDIGLSLDDKPEITDLRQLIENKMTLLVAVGSPKFIEGVREVRMNELDLDRVALLLENRRVDFYIYNKSTLEYFLRKNKLKDFMLHPECCGGVKPLYLGFSQNSPKFKALKNPDYDPLKPFSKENFPITADPACVASKFAGALMNMKSSGEIASIYEKYYYENPKPETGNQK